ncbi:precorrin-6y C5,15-methyltransferase (decarboxylating) subunit CbiE [Methylocystis sp. L43]|uniref:precorrin-6y C5,15-methyltransferase (decarboxylating) subunit CbiE n=1 Tax=unclassified Methylocystis TaxID=2625913 RepID=UPI0018C30E1E|nr:MULTISPECIES: precorrin-6y C5,15-methyltransferase (decarboxylating) subunit CbiE [unclassified Methylocystis]MBG0798773.1 precorrin-6y C5,15-methyltransferase (decarboxylating) subunit CbiE [Methylocystis sp. L43]MBG0806280.1 precorrin-6y C5,15-methyltransferase (decarboxylating) subunit CbiE [Methylocystis sp. H15]
MNAPWLSLIGLGEDGADALTPAARALLAQASLIVGGARHLAMIDAPAERLQWPSPLSDALPQILAHRGKPTVVLASGDPFFYGVGDLIARHVAPDEIFCVPAPSAFSLAAARLKWSLQDCALLSLHGRAFERVTPHLQPRAKIIALSWDETTPARLAGHLALRGMGGSRLYVLERLGGAHERVREARADAFALNDIAPLNTVALEIEAGGDAAVIPLAPGLPDDWFEHDGQLTKHDIRAVTICALAPRKGELLWDVGAGAGSVAIEWMLSDPANRAIAIERDATRAARIARNALSLGVPDLSIVKGEAPQALAELDAPQAIFIGGGADAATLAAAWDALPRFGRIVVNAVTIETQSLLADAYRDNGGELIHLQIAHARPIGRFHALDPAMAVTQWRATKR